MRQIPATLVFFESPKRVTSFLKDALDTLGNRGGAVCREMTKLYEEVQRNSLSDLMGYYETHPPRGEVVIVIEGGSLSDTMGREARDVLLRKTLETHSLKEAVDLVAKAFGLSKREVYQHALELKHNQNEN